MHWYKYAMTTIEEQRNRMARYAQLHEEARAQGFVTKLDLPIHLTPQLQSILAKLEASGTPGLVVGGAVRDAMLGAHPKDLDVEVYNTTLDNLAELLSAYGHVDLVGRQFGVLKLRTQDGQDFDFSVPRRDNKVGLGHKDFTTTFDPTLTPADAASRRDFTINSMAYDPITHELHDYWGGERDLHDKVLRATSPAFMEDSLRVLRGLQFTCRFGFHIDPETAKMCQEMAEGYKALPKERVFGEWEKLLTKGKDYSAMFEYLKQTGWDRFFPHVSNMVGVPQENEWHPEGDCDRHTAHVMNAAREIADRKGLTGFKRLLLMTAALTHDVGKPSNTQRMMKGGQMRWTSHGHEAAGGPLAKSFLEQLGASKQLIQAVVPLVERHLEHIKYKGTPSIGMIRQFAHDIAPATIEDMALLMEADHSGRPPLPKGLPGTAQLMLSLARDQGVSNGKPARIIEGGDVMPYFNNVGGPYIGQAVNDAYAAYLSGKYHDKPGGLEWLDKHIQSKAQHVKGEDVIPYFGGAGGPQVGQVMRDAWGAQTAGDFTNRDDALDWLQWRMDTHPFQKEPTAPDLAKS